MKRREMIGAAAALAAVSALDRKAAAAADAARDGLEIATVRLKPFENERLPRLERRSRPLKPERRDVRAPTFADDAMPAARQAFDALPLT